MQQPYLLPGAFSSPRRRTNLGPVFVTIFLFVFAGAGYAIWLGLRKRTPRRQILQSRKARPCRRRLHANLLMEDLNIHFQNAIRSTVRSSELAKQSETHIRAVLPAMDRNYLNLERARLEAAISRRQRYAKLTVLPKNSKSPND